MEPMLKHRTTENASGVVHSEPVCQKKESFHHEKRDCHGFEFRYQIIETRQSVLMFCTTCLDGVTIQSRDDKLS